MTLDEVERGLDYLFLGKGRNDGDFVRHMDDLDDQPNPEGDDTGGPAGGQREFLDWLAGRSPQAGNRALNRPITSLDVLGQPGADGSRYRESNPNRFSRIWDDINPSMRGGETERDDSTWCPPVDPDGKDDRGWMIDPLGPLGPGGSGGPGGPGPVKEGDR